jgi:hypothetical protein
MSSAAAGLMLHCRTSRGSSRHTARRYPIHPFLISTKVPFMTTLFLALVPLVFAAGFLTWTMIMGAREQSKADAWAAEWADKHHGTH